MGRNFHKMYDYFGKPMNYNLSILCNCSMMMSSPCTKFRHFLAGNVELHVATVFVTSHILLYRISGRND